MSSKKWKNRDALETAYDDHIIELQSVINQRSKYSKRAEGKPMAAIEDPDNPHITNRGEHMRQAASEAIKIAKGLGLNEVVAYIGMLMHDAGQPFGAHDGEKTMNIIGEILHIGFYHHNAKGVDVILSEDLIQKFVDSIPEAKNDIELQNKLKEEAWYFLELVVGHDGEATSKDNERYAKLNKKYGSIKEAVLDKVSKANRTDDYKCAVETLEAQISKPADILSYMKSDILTGFSKGILTELSDDYLEIIGKLLAESNEETIKIEKDIEQAYDEDRKEIIAKIRKNRVEKAKEIIESIKISKLKETRDYIVLDSEKEILKEVNKVIKQLRKGGIEITNIKPEQEEILQDFIEETKKQFKEKKIKSGENKNTVISQANKIEEYITKIKQTRKRVVEEVLNRMQDALRNDYIETTLSKWKEIEENSELNNEERYKLKKQSMDFSDKVNKIIYGRNGIKDLNYREYVQYSKKIYQTGILPKGTLKLVEKCAEAIKETGVIVNKFYDPEVLKYIDNQELIDLMQQRDIDEEHDEKYKRKIGIIKEKANKAKGVKNLGNKRFKSKKTKQKMERKSLYRKIYRNAQTQEERFARTCEDIYYAIPHTVRNMVEKAVRTDYEENEYLPDEEREKVNETRKKLAKRFGQNGTFNITKENLEAYINEQIEEERKQIELKVALQISRDYIAGKTDIGINDLLVKTGIISKRELEKQNQPNKKGNRVVQKLSQDLREENR